MTLLKNFIEFYETWKFYLYFLQYSMDIQITHALYIIVIKLDLFVIY